jgi:hypothetical protein
MFFLSWIYFLTASVAFTFTKAHAFDRRSVPAGVQIFSCTVPGKYIKLLEVMICIFMRTIHVLKSETNAHSSLNFWFDQNALLLSE